MENVSGEDFLVNGAGFDFGDEEVGKEPKTENENNQGGLRNDDGELDDVENFEKMQDEENQEDDGGAERDFARAALGKEGKIMFAEEAAEEIEDDEITVDVAKRGDEGGEDEKG